MRRWKNSRSTWNETPARYTYSLVAGKRGCEADTARTKSHRRSRKYVDDQCGDHLGTGDQDYKVPESATIERTSGYLPGEMPGDIRDRCPADPAATPFR